MANKTYDLSNIDEGFEEENESTPSYDLSDIDEGFDDGSVIDNEEVVAPEDEPSTPVVGKKKEDTVSESESQSEAPLSDSLPKEEVSTPEPVKATPSAPTAKSKEDVKSYASLEDELEATRKELEKADLKAFADKQALDVSQFVKPEYEDTPYAQMEYEQALETDPNKHLRLKIAKLEKDIKLRDDVKLNYSPYEEDQLDLVKKKAIKGFEEDSNIRREFEVNQKIKELTKGDDALRTAKFGSTIDSNLEKRISEVNTDDEKASLSKAMSDEIALLMSRNGVPSWYSEGLDSSEKAYKEKVAKEETEAILKGEKYVPQKREDVQFPVSDADLKAKAKALSGLRAIDKKAASLNEERNKFLNEELFSQVNEDIDNIKEKLYNGDITKEEASEAIKTKEAYKANFFEDNGSEAAKNITESSGVESQTVYKDFLRMMNEDEKFKNMSPKEKFDNFYLSLEAYSSNKAKEAGLFEGTLDDIGTQIRDHFNTKDFFGLPLPENILSLSDEEKEALQALNMVKALEPVFYNNRLTDDFERDSFFESFWGTFYSSLFPETAGLTFAGGESAQAEKQRVLASLSEEELGIEDKSINKDAVNSLQEAASPKSLMGEDFSLFNPLTYGNVDFDWTTAGNLAGTTGAIMFTMAEANLIGGGLGKLTPITRLDKTSKVGQLSRKAKASMLKTMRKSPRLSKYVAPAFEEGAKFEFAGEIFENQQEELNFASGFLGKLGGQLTEGVLDKAAKAAAYQKIVERYSSVFGPKAQAAVTFTKTALSRGFGEVQEETIQELTNIWQQTPEGKSFLEELRTRFPDLKSAEEFIISSLVMGTGMGFGGKGGALNAAIKKYRSAKDAQTKVLDQVTAEIATDIQIASQEAAMNETIENLKKAGFDVDPENIQSITRRGRTVADGEISYNEDVIKTKDGKSYYISTSNVEGDEVSSDNAFVDEEGGDFEYLFEEKENLTDPFVVFGKDTKDSAETTDVEDIQKETTQEEAVPVTDTEEGTADIEATEGVAVEESPVVAEEKTTEDTEAESTVVEEEAKVEPEPKAEEEVEMDEEDDLDKPVTVKKITPEESRTNRLLDYVDEHNRARGSKQKSELSQRINSMAASLGLTVKTVSGDKKGEKKGIQILNDKGKKVSRKSDTMVYKEQPQSDIDAVKKAIEGGILEDTNDTDFDIPGLSTGQVLKGIRDIKAGKTTTEPAKALAIGFRNARKQGGFGVRAKLGNNNKGDGTFIELDTFESELATQAEEVMTEEAAREVPQNVKDAIMAAEAETEGDVLSDTEQAFVDANEDTEVDSIESMSDEDVDTVLSEAQEALGATDEEVAQMAEVIKENNKQDKDGEQEQGEGVQTAETVVEDTTSSEQGAEQEVKKEKSKVEKYEEASKRLAEKIRSNKLKNLGSMMSGGPHTLLVDLALETIALSLEKSPSIVKAIDAAINAIKNHPAWKKLTPEQRKKMINGLKTDVAQTLEKEQESVLSEVEEETKKTKKEPKKKKDTDTPSERNKSFLNRVLADPNTPKSHKEMLSDISTKYTQESNEWQSDQADILIDVFDKDGRVDDLWAEISDLNNDISFGVRAMIALKLKRLNDEKGQHRKAASISDWIDKTARKFGQFNQALIDRGSPESVLRSKTNEWDEKAKDRMAKNSNSKSGKTVGEDIEDAVSDMNEASEKAAKEIAEGVDLEEKVEEVKKKMSKQEALAKAREAKRQKKEAKEKERDEKLAELKKKRANAKQKLKESRSKYFNASIGGFTAEGIELAAEIASTYIEEGIVRLDKLAEKIRDFFKSDLDIDLTDAQIQEILNYNYNGKTAIDFLTEERMAEAKQKLSQRVINATKDKKTGPSTLDAIDVILKELTLKAKQDIPKQNKGESADAYRNRVLDAMQSQDIAKEIWGDAQVMVEEALDKKVDDGKMTPAERAEVMEKLQGFFGDFVGRPFADTVLEKAVSEQLKSMNQKVKDIITKHWTEKAQIGQDLAAKFVNGAGLSPEAAEELANEVIAEYNKKIQEAAEKALTKTLGTSKLPSKGKKKTDTQKLIEAFNLGALDSEMFKELFSEKFGLISLNNADKQAIGKFIHDLNLYPENSEALHRGMADFKRYLRGVEKDSYKAKFFFEFLTEVFYTSVLSGFSTLARGAKGVAMTAAAELLVESVKNPKLFFTTNQGISALYRGFRRGGKEFASIMRDGYVPISKNLENTTGSLDYIHNAKWSDLNVGSKFNKAFFYIPVKMVRALIATDALAHYTVREAFALTAAYNKVLRTGMDKKSAEFWSDVEKELHNNKADQIAARRQALTEKQMIIDRGGDLSKFDVERRTREILDDMRADDIKQFSESKADKSRLGQDPTGILGAVYVRAVDAQKTFLGLNRIIPFLRIPTNAMDMWLDWTPWGYKRAAFGKSSLLGLPMSEASKKKLKIGKKGYTDAEWAQERTDHLIKASLGTLAFAGIAAAALGSIDEDDDDKWFDISYKGHGNFRDNEGLRQQGWKEMSFRFKNPFTGEYTEWFDYRDSPLAMVFSTIGSIHDEKKYKRAGEVDNDDDAAELAKVGVINSLLFVSEQNYTKSLMNLSNVFSREGTVESNASNFSGDYVKKNVQSVFFPNIYKQSYQIYKALIQKNEKMTTRYSDNWTKGVFEGVIKDLPYIEDNLTEEMFDQLGYPITRRIDDVPLIPEMVLDGMQTIIGDRENEKPAWELLNKHKMTIGWDGSKTYEGRTLDTDEQLKLKRLTASKIRERLEDPNEYEYLNELNREDFVKEIQSIKSQASKESKDELFGEY